MNASMVPLWPSACQMQMCSLCRVLPPMDGTSGQFGLTGVVRGGRGARIDIQARVAVYLAIVSRGMGRNARGCTYQLQHSGKPTPSIIIDCRVACLCVFLHCACAQPHRVHSNFIVQFACAVHACSRKGAFGSMEAFSESQRGLRHIRSRSSAAFCRAPGRAPPEPRLTGVT